MREYIIVGSFIYKDISYSLLLDDERKYYFLRNVEGGYEYISIQELIELKNIFVPNLDVKLLVPNQGVKRRIKLVPMILIGGIAFTLSFSIYTALFNQKYKINFDDTYPRSITTTIDEKEEGNYSYSASQEALDRLLSSVAKENENFQVETIYESSKYVTVYDFGELDRVLGYTKDSITYDTIRETIKNNYNIPERFKALYIELANNLEKKYPNMDLRIWYENLKTLKIIECNEQEMHIKALSVSAFACYRSLENTIYTVKDYEYEPNTWNYQVIMHEMTHPIRTLSRDNYNGKKFRVHFASSSGYGNVIDEALNSSLSLRSYDEDERDIAYQLQSNMLEVMIDSMDNYTLQDYVEHNITYLENELNKQNEDDKAVEIISLIELQYKDYHDDNIKVNQEEYHKTYDYIAKMYYRKNLHPGMSYEDACLVRDNFIDRITYDVPEEYNIDTQHMMEYFEEYINENNIIKSIVK